MLRIARFAAIGILVCIVTTGALLPWAVYWIGLESIDGRPATIANGRSADEVKALWTLTSPICGKNSSGISLHIGCTIGYLVDFVRNHAMGIKNTVECRKWRGLSR